MLSKVLSGREADRIASASFPSVEALVAASSSPSSRGAQGDSEVRAERLRQAEIRAAAEQSEAFQHARREAFEQGRRQGEQEARAELHPVIERLSASLGDLAALRPELRRRAERDTVQLALLIARRILHRELSVDENALSALARVAFERLTRLESCTVTVHPRFAAAIAAALPAAQAPRVRIEPDPSCAPGALVFQSADGVIDASVESQFEEIGRGLADRLGHSQGGNR